MYPIVTLPSNPLYRYLGALGLDKASPHKTKERSLCLTLEPSLEFQAWLGNQTAINMSILGTAILLLVL